MVTNQKQSKWSPWQRTAWPVDVTVKVRDVFLSIFFIDEIEKYFGDLTGRHASVVAVASSHSVAR